VLPQTASAQVIHACVNNSSGDMKIVPAGATCPRNSSPLSWNVQGAQGPPGQGATVLVDANGVSVGRLVLTVPLLSAYPWHYAMRQINGIWVLIPVSPTDFLSVGPFSYWYQSTDCTGQAYLSVNWGVELDNSPSSPAMGWLATLPPANIPSIYFAGAPSRLTVSSYRNPGESCIVWNNGTPPTMYVGIPQSVSVSSLGLTPPFSIK
jgi:hypothetical protein